ncbi:MAG: class I SAM-dependent methyltransferase [Patescibacteria group bacterium]
MRDIIQKTREDYNKIAKYFSDTRYDSWFELEQFKKLVKDGQNILDWGCGNGRLIFLLQSKNIKYFGIDQSENLIKIAKTKFSREVKKGRAKFFCTAKKRKSFPPGFFDLVFMVASFHHLPDKTSRLQLLTQAYKEMRKGGKIIITVWNLGSDWAKQKFKKDWQKIGENDFLIPWKNSQGELQCQRYYHHFSKEELRGLLKEAGFKVKKLDYYNKDNWTDEKIGRDLIAIAEKTKI